MTTVNPLTSPHDAIVYLDIKSPYAFVAWQPTVRRARRLGMSIDWRPLTLDIPSYLGSARVDDQGNVLEQSRSDEQWAWVRYAYNDARRYAGLDDFTLRGTVKIWDSSLAHIAFMWVKHHDEAPERCAEDSLLQRYLQAIYPPFWRRELDVENPDVIEQLLTQAGAPLVGFRDYLEGQGRREHDTMQEAIFDAGIYGVPSYVVDGELYFGREHLPRVCWIAQLRKGPAPDVSYGSSSADEPETPMPPQSLAAQELTLPVAIDFKDPQCYLALGPLRKLADDLGITLDWQPLQSQARDTLADLPDGNDRTSRHLRARARYVASDIERYAKSQGLELRGLERSPDSRLAALALSWLRRTCESPETCERFVELVLEGHWRVALDIEDVSAIKTCLQRVGAPATNFDPDEEQSHLDRSSSAWLERGAWATPCLQISDQLFIGRAHIPMVRWLLTDRAGPSPI